MTCKQKCKNLGDGAYQFAMRLLDALDAAFSHSGLQLLAMKMQVKRMKEEFQARLKNCRVTRLKIRMARKGRS